VRRSGRPNRSPYALRLLVFVVGVCLLFAAAPAAAATQVTRDPQLGAEIAAAINDLRRENGLSDLRTSRALTRAARAHASSMGRLGYFSHSSADGTSPIRRIVSFYGVHGSSWAVGEVMVWATGVLSPARALAIWLASPPHRAQVLSRKYREVGVGAVHAEDAPGVYGGRDVTIVVVDFGRK
jgi:uncharacterized protein YkwD